MASGQWGKSRMLVSWLGKLNRMKLAHRKSFVIFFMLKRKQKQETEKNHDLTQSNWDTNTLVSHSGFPA